MKFDIKIKYRWPLSWIFKPKTVSVEILPELTEDEKALKRELMKDALVSQIRARREEASRMIRG